MALTEVILVNEADESIGTMEKMEAHEKALLHRAFSVFIFNRKNEMLLQQRADSKYHSGGLWTNACCSHPFPGEDIATAASRRLHEEMGFKTALEKIFTFIYRSEFENGLTEHEYDHVFIGTFEGQIKINDDEVKDYLFKPMDEIAADIKEFPGKYTSWFRIAFPRIRKWMHSKNNHTFK